MGPLRVKRVYEAPEPEDGFRVLVDRIWPRGMSRERAAVDLWLKSAAPSTDLRQWFAHDPARWNEFRRRYRRELAAKPELLKELRQRCEAGALTLVYSARDVLHNQAVALSELLGEDFGSARSGLAGESPPFG